MMIGERNHPNTTVHVPPLLDDDLTDDTSFHLPVSGTPISHRGGGGIADYCSTFDSLTTALRGYLPSTDVDLDSDDSGSPLDASYSCDQFRMYEFKVRQCTRGRSHDWTDCPYAHPGEKARRRDPRKYNYSGTSCPDFRKGSCKKGDDCEFAHGVFECWLHPARYRTQPCKDGLNCRRRVCFFAHSPDQLRVLSPGTPGSSVESFDGSPHSHRLSFSSQTESAPMSPVTNSLNRSLGSHPINDMVASLRHLQLNKVKTIPSSWASLQIGVGSPRVSMSRAAFCSLPSTPTMSGTRTGIGLFDLSEDEGGYCEEEPAMERVESGRDLRAKIFEKLSRENPLDGVDPSPPSPAPDVGWVSELVI